MSRPHTRADLSNPNNPAYWKSFGWKARPDDWEERHRRGELWPPSAPPQSRQKNRSRAGKADWARLFHDLAIEYAGDGMEALEKGVGGWLPDLALRRGNGGWVWVEIMPKPTMFSPARAKMDGASDVDPETDALLFACAHPAHQPHRDPYLWPWPLGLGAVSHRNEDTGERKWEWGVAWYGTPPGGSTHGGPGALCLGQDTVLAPSRDGAEIDLSAFTNASLDSFMDVLVSPDEPSIPEGELFGEDLGTGGLTRHMPPPL